MRAPRTSRHATTVPVERSAARAPRTARRNISKRPDHLTRRHFQGPLDVRARLWWRTRRDGSLLLAPFRITGRGARTALDRIEIGPGTRIGQFAWFSLTGEDARFSVGRDCTLGPLFAMSARQRVSIGDATTIADRCLIIDHDHDHMGYLAPALAGEAPPAFNWAKREAAPVHVGRGVHIGFNVVVMPGVTIGDGSVVGANSVVNTDVEPFTMYAGAPARLVRRLRPADPTAGQPVRRAGGAE